MSHERFEWLEIPEERLAPRTSPRKEAATVMGKRCPQCGWLDEETATVCFRCGYRYNVDREMNARIGQLGVDLPPRVIETPQSLENFFRTHGRVRQPEPLEIFRLQVQAEALRHGIAIALANEDSERRMALKRAGMLTRDARIKERKKYDQPGARKRFQYSKR